MKKFIFVIALLVLYMPTFASWNGSSAPWTQGTGTYYNPYRIESGEHLAYLADMVNAGVNDYHGQHFLLANDISLSNHIWTPIGDLTHKFRGNFDGGNHTIDSLMLELRNDNNYYGLFGNVADGEISNLTVYIKTQYIVPTGSGSGYIYVGGIACRAESETFYNCITHGIVFDYLNSITNFYPTSSHYSKSYAGGIVCKGISNIQVFNCINNCAVYARDVGGLICQLEVDSTDVSIIEDCENNGNLTGYLSVGGIVGRITGKVNIGRCSNNGYFSRKQSTWSDYGLYSGGIVGLFDIGCILSCYNKGNITMKGSFPSNHHGYCGGIAGCISSESIIKYCYNRGNLTMTGGSSSSTNYVYFAGISYGYNGAIVNSCYNTGTMSLANGTIYGDAFQGNITNCYYRSDCGATTGGTPRSEANMKTAVFVTMLNADSVVYIMDANNVNDGYPIHAWTTFNVYTDSVSEIESSSARLWGHYEGTPSSMGFLLRETNSGNEFTDLHYNFAVSPVVRTVDLSANTAYEFCFYAIKDGTRVCGDTLSFQTLMNDTDTTSGGGASADTVFITVHDTVIVNNYIHDTTVINHFFYDTTYIDNYIHDTTYITNCDSTIFQYIHDTVYISQYDTTIIRYVHDTAYVWLHDTIMIPQEIVYRTLSVTSGNPNQGIAAGSGQFPIGTRVEIAAVPLEGNRFLQWSDGSTQNPHAITLNSDLTMIAIFSYESLNVPVNSSWSLSVETGALLVDGVAGETVRIFDVLGRLLKTYVNSADQIRYLVPASGGYIVQVGNGSAKKITVIR